ncbi:MAG: hypothetical protein II471_04335, partial [Bacteroidales bacterium]|nr:hypothetical protein [Bacteroidales bacterium]
MTRFKIAMYNDLSLRKKYLRILDIISANRTVTPEITAYAAKKLGFDISAEDFEKEESERRFSADELESVASANDDFAPDGRRMGCPMNFYMSWTDYWIRNDHESCPKGGHHEIIESSADCICKKCRLSLSERGLIDIYDKYG